MKGENPQRKTHKETPRNAIAWTASSGNAHSWGVEWDTRTQAKAEAFHEMEPWQFMKWGTHSSWNGAFQVAVLDLALNLRRRWRRLLGELPEAELKHLGRGCTGRWRRWCGTSGTWTPSSAPPPPLPEPPILSRSLGAARTSLAERCGLSITCKHLALWQDDHVTVVVVEPQYRDYEYNHWCALSHGLCTAPSTGTTTSM
eukprot:75322-Rhodomonas_salina.1